MGKKVKPEANELRLRELVIARNRMEDEYLRLVRDREGLDATQWTIYILDKAAKAQFAEWDRKTYLWKNRFEKREELRFLAKVRL